MPELSAGETMRISLFEGPWVNLYRDEIELAIAEVLESGDFVMGERVRRFEREFAAYCGVRHCLTTDSGTASLHLALRALGVGPGDEVITAANTDIATCLSIEHAGATVRLADIEAATFNINPAALEEAIGPHTKAIVPVHMHGLPCDMDKILGIAKRHNLLIVEDAALAAGATYHGKHVGKFSDAAIFSFYPGKVFSGVGMGGAVVTDCEETAYLVNSLRHLGREASPYGADRVPGSSSPSGVTVRLGFNARFNTLQAAVLSVRLAHLNEEISRRRAIAGIYDRYFADAPVTVPTARSGYGPVYRTYVVRVPNRDRLHSRLLARGIETNVHYVPPVHLHPYYRDKGYQKGAFPVTETVANELLCLPCHSMISTDEAREVAETTLSFLSA